MMGRTNVGGGGTGGTLTVTTPGAGITVTVSKDGKSKTKLSGADGVAVFKGMESGTWTVTISDGEQTSVPRTFTVTADYAVELTFFAATIHVTYPAGSTCTASDGVTTLTAPDTSGAWEFVVSNAGAWTVTSSDGNTRTVNITKSGESVTVDLTKLVLFSAASTYFGTWEPNAWASSASAVKRYVPELNVADTLELTVPSSAGNVTGCMSNSLPIDLSKYKTMHIKLYSSKTQKDDSLTINVGLVDKYEDKYSWLARSNNCTTTEQEYTFDLSNLNTTGYAVVGFWQNYVGVTVTVTELYLE